VIFDFEGTLVDFQWRLEPAERELRLALARLGLEGAEFAAADYSALWNTAAARARSPARLAELRRALYPIYDRWDADALSRWTPRRGAAAVLRRLSAARSRIGLVSNVGRAALGEALERFGFSRWLRPVVSRNDVSRLKPDAEGILAVLREWNLPSDAVLFVGDSRADVLAARGSGLPVAILRGGECGEADFAGTPPDFLLSRLEDMPDLVRAGAGGARDRGPGRPGRSAAKRGV
jgi:phosphoglycolate phosphatase-like HAD superfamily hydrolase